MKFCGIFVVLLKRSHHKMQGGGREKKTERKTHIATGYATIATTAITLLLINYLTLFDFISAKRSQSFAQYLVVLSSKEFEFELRSVFNNNNRKEIQHRTYNIFLTKVCHSGNFLSPDA